MKLKNRIVMPPMCMYQARDGMANDWHLIHYGSRAIGGTGLIILEATGVTPGGRITDYDIGLWADAQIEPLRRIVDAIHAEGAKAAIQLIHAGRKSSVSGLKPLGPSPVAFNQLYPEPEAISKQGIAEIVDAFAAAARRAVKAGFDGVELHAAHGYLMHEFMSPAINARDDEYGGSREGRTLFLREIISAVRSSMGPEAALWARVSAHDYVDGGLTPGEVGEMVQSVAPLGLDAIHVSSGGGLPVKPDEFPGYQVTMAETVRRITGLPTMAVGKITSPELAEEILKNGRADLVAIGRELLGNPHWPLMAARELGVELEWPKSYERAKPR
jgi:NADPH2 dehydrogenase